MEWGLPRIISAWAEADPEVVVEMAVNAGPGQFLFHSQIRNDRIFRRFIVKSYEVPVFILFFVNPICIP